MKNPDSIVFVYCLILFGVMFIGLLVLVWVQNTQMNTLWKEVKQIMATQQELVQQLTDLTANVTKIGAETTTLIQKVTDLEAALAGQANVTPELQAAFDALKAQVVAVDELVPDQPAPPV